MPDDVGDRLFGDRLPDLRRRGGRRDAAALPRGDRLRGLADGPAAPLKLVIASRSPLAHLFPDSPELDSPLAGICRQLDVLPFSPEAARAFLADRLRDTGVTFSPEEKATAIEESGGHPARLQQILRELYDQRAST